MVLSLSQADAGAPAVLLDKLYAAVF